ncbi:MAG: hypothetical protein ABI823_07040 [Bryobacteraceae bacterium]
MTSRHPSEIDLALYSSGDQAMYERLKTALHVRRCAHCSGRVVAYRGDGEVVKNVSLTMPSSVDWERLSEEMTGNIHVGLAAGECVGPVHSNVKQVARGGMGWQKGLVFAGLGIVMLGAWWLNTASVETTAMGRIGRALWTGTPVAMLADPGVSVEASPGGVVVKENGSSMALTSSGSRPVAVSVSLQGAARARYMDDDTGQMTITTVYVQ